ncbi:hypothetical protein TEA_005807 [Camellia sinensis var. sinensis]|uniref:Serine aminopeptidase S33 domain-containing protein n=1 Tax=Camellia sinensis var. sinensis TaxID=542762 RepID=A0A4S4EUS5_CAMSN|nr:hypothetical protein TEA_005807 [Camellia sinensis var. sinensis]
MSQMKFFVYGSSVGMSHEVPIVKEHTTSLTTDQSEAPICPLQTRLWSSLQRRLRSFSSPSSDTTPELSSDTTSKLFFALEDYPANITQLDNNHFDGATIPDSYGNMSPLLKLSLRNCSLQGQIPDLSRIPHLAYIGVFATTKAHCILVAGPCLRSLIPYFVVMSERDSHFADLKVENCEPSCNGVSQLVDVLVLILLSSSKVGAPLGKFLGIELVKQVERTVRSENYRSPNRPIYLVGESLGGCLALAVAARNPDIDLILILANPATCFGKSQLQHLIPFLEIMPEQLHLSVPYVMSSFSGIPLRMVMATVEKGLPLQQTVGEISQGVIALSSYLSVRSNICM